jgi:transcription antitermination factor NusG
VTSMGQPIQVKMRPATGRFVVSFARTQQVLSRLARPTRVDEREVHNHEAKRIRQQAKRCDKQRPEVQALEAPESREDEEQ